MPQPTSISPLRQRLIDDMTLRAFSPKTHWPYVHGVKVLAEFLHCSPDKATADDLRLFRLHLVDRGYSVHMINQSRAVLRFFHRVTVPRDDLVATIPYIKQPEQLPVVLSQDEVTRLLAAAPGFKYQVMLSTCYAAGLRVSELVNLKVTDIDSSRIVIRVEQSKGTDSRPLSMHRQLLFHASHRGGEVEPAAVVGIGEIMDQTDSLLKYPKMIRHLLAHPNTNQCCASTGNCAVTVTSPRTPATG